MKVTGVDKVKSMLKRFKEKKLRQTTLGVKTAGAFILAESQKIVPVDYGILKASGFTRIEKPNTAKVQCVVGYTAKYAIYVHENLDAAHGAEFNEKYAKELMAARRMRRKKTGGTTGPFRHSRGPNQQAKFLETPLRQNRKAIKAIIESFLTKGKP